MVNEMTTLVHTASIRTVRDTVVERGSIESQQTVEGKNRLPGETKIIFIVPEGTNVKTGDVVVRLDSEMIDKAINSSNFVSRSVRGKK